MDFSQLSELPDLRNVQGREAFRESWADWLNTWRSQRSEIEEIHERGDRVLVFSRDRFEAREGLGIDWRGSSVFTIRNGKIVRMEAFGEDHDAARAAFGGGAGDVGAP